MTYKYNKNIAKPLTFEIQHQTTEEMLIKI